MKRTLLSILLLMSMTSCYAVDYVIEAMSAFSECRNSGTRCEDVKRYTQIGIKVYSPNRYNSITNLKKYCGLVYLDMMHQGWGNQARFMEDVMELNGTCQAVGAFQ